MEYPAVDVSQFQWFLVTKPEQNRLELEWFLSHFVDGKSSVLEIGCGTGAMLVEFAKRLGYQGIVRGISWPASMEEAKLLSDTVEILRGTYPDAYVAAANSRDPCAIEWASAWAPYDVVFIDGDHSYEGVHADWLNYGTMGKVVAFHDIADSNLGTRQFWEEISGTIRGTVEFVEFMADPRGQKGIGVVIQES